MDEKLIRYNNAVFNLNTAKKYLADTDYVDNKIIEAMVLGGDVEALKKKYAETLAKRAEVRASIDDLQKEVDEAYKELTEEE